MCGEPLRAQILILNCPSYNRSCWTGQTGWAGAHWVELLGKYVLICLCSANKEFPPGTGRALGTLRGDGERGGGRNSVLPSTGHLELALSGSSWWCCLWKCGLDHGLPPCSCQWCCSPAREFPALALEFPLNTINAKVSELFYGGSMSPGGIVAIASRAGNWELVSLFCYWHYFGKNLLVTWRYLWKYLHIHRIIILLCFSRKLAWVGFGGFGVMCLFFVGFYFKPLL